MEPPLFLPWCSETNYSKSNFAVRDGVSIKMTNLCKCDDWLAGFFTLMTVILFLGSGTAIGAVFSLAFAKREFRNINSGYTT